MSPAVVLGLVMFAFAASITPGPNNTLLLASGVNFGLKRTLPLALAVSCGMLVEILALGWGLGAVFTRWPVVFLVLRWGGAAYLLWLAWKMATSKGVGGAAERSEPLTFLQAFAFQAVNPKAWFIALTVVTTYAAGGGFTGSVLLAAVICVLINAPCILTWAAFGTVLRRFLDRPNVLRVFNVVMALLLIASLYPLLTTPAFKP